MRYTVGDLVAMSESDLIVLLNFGSSDFKNDLHYKLIAANAALKTAYKYLDGDALHVATAAILSEVVIDLPM